MHAFYINLDSQQKRKRVIEDNFSEHLPYGWKLHRVEAVGLQLVDARETAGKIRQAEKACLLSHMRAIEQSLEHQGHGMVLEDDALFGPNSCQVIERSLEKLDETPWDILYTDICVPTPQWMLELFLLRRDLVAKEQIVLLSLHDAMFAGATAYIVNDGAKGKLMNMLLDLEQFDLPYDLQLRRWMADGYLKGFAIFPFATSLFAYADDSQVQEKATWITDAAWNAFRRLVWVDAERCPDDPLNQIRQIDAGHYDPLSQKFSGILSVMLSPHFKPK